MSRSGVDVTSSPGKRSGLAGVLVVAAIGLALWTITLPFGPGSPFVDLFVPVGALILAATGSRLALKAQVRQAGWARVGSLVVGIVGLLTALTAALFLFMIFALCGAYWAGTSC